WIGFTRFSRYVNFFTKFSINSTRILIFLGLFLFNIIPLTSHNVISLSNYMRMSVHHIIQYFFFIILIKLLFYFFFFLFFYIYLYFFVINLIIIIYYTILLL